jgi:hypothetical protein
MLNELDKEAARNGMNRSEYLLFLLERRNTTEFNARVAVERDSMAAKLGIIEPLFLAQQDRLHYIEHDILGSSYRRAKGKRVRIKDTDEFIEVKSIEDYIKILVKITNLTDDENSED